MGLAGLLLGLVLGDADLGDADVDGDGPFSLPAIAAFTGGVGFGGAAVTALLPELPGVVTVLVALAGGLVVALPLAAGAVRLSAALRDMPTEPTLTALGRSVAANVAQGLQLSGDLTGLDVGAMLRRLGEGAADDVGSAAPVTRVPLDGNGVEPDRVRRSRGNVSRPPADQPVLSYPLLCDVDHGLAHEHDLVMSRRGGELVVTDAGGRRVGAARRHLRGRGGRPAGPAPPRRRRPRAARCDGRHRGADGPRARRLGPAVAPRPAAPAGRLTRPGVPAGTSGTMPG